MHSDTFRRLREGDKVFHEQRGKIVFTVIGSAYEDTIVFARHASVTNHEIRRWRRVDATESPLTNIRELAVGERIASKEDPFNEYVVAKIVDDHAYGVCILEARSADAKHWHLRATVQLRVE